jgi:hypothetical protein
VLRIIKIDKELTNKLTLIIIGLTAASGLLIPATYASLHPVTTGEIADNTIRSVDIENGEVSTADIGTGQVRTGDIGNGQVAAVDIANNALQPNIQENIESETIEAGTFEEVVAGCPAGTIVTGGGYDTSSAVRVHRNFPHEDLDAWQVSGFNTSPNTDAVLVALVLCMGPMP